VSNQSRFEETVIKLIAEVAPNASQKKITLDTQLQRELGMNSLAIALLVFRFEEAFEVDIAGIEDKVDITAIRTVNDVIRVARELVGGAASR
jgi:acyl carrier protein